MIYTEEEMQELRNENKKLKWLLKEHVTTYDVHFDELIEENKKLKEYNWELIEKHKKDISILCEENKKLKEEIDELDRVNHNLNAKLSDLYDVKQILRDIVININRLDKLKEIVFKYDTKPED